MLHQPTPPSLMETVNTHQCIPKILPIPKKFDTGVGGGMDQDNHPYPRGLLAQKIPNSPYNAPAYSAKFDGNGQYSPVWVEDFTDSKKFDTGVGGGIDQDSHPYPRGLLA